MKKNKTIILILLSFYISVITFSQDYPNRFVGWRLTSLSGEAKIKGQYREYEIFSYGISELQKNSYLSGGGMVNTKSFLLHPNFLLIDVDAGYFPETTRDNYIVFPDQSEVRTLKKLDLRTTLFQQKNINLINFAYFNDMYQNRENLTDLKSTSKQWGGTLLYNNKYLPVTAGIRLGQQRQQEISTGRRFNMDERVLYGKTNRSFGTRDRAELTFTHNEYLSRNIIPGKDENLFSLKNIIDDFHLTNNMAVDEKRKYLFNTILSDFNHRGNRNYNRFKAMEAVTMRLPENLTFSGNYDFNQIRQETIKSKNQSVQGSLSHKLYLSLTSTLFFENNTVNHSMYRENIRKTGLNIHYTKKIPTHGRLTMTYTFFRLNENMSANPSYLPVTDEDYTLTDGQMVLFKRPYVMKESVVVKDASGTMTYQENFDYILIDKDPYLEIVRVPGGMISNNATVLINYTAMQPGSYKYDTDNHSFMVNAGFFHNKWETYYGITTQDYKNLSNTELQVLNYFTQYVIGSRLVFGFISGGAEYTDNQSTILPHRKTRYYINIQKNYSGKIFLTLNGNVQDYYLVKEKIYQKYSDITGKIACALFKQTKINFDMMYRNQTGLGIDLDMITAKCEISSAMRQVNLSAGVEFYRRLYLGEKVNFRGVYLQVSRRF